MYNRLTDSYIGWNPVNDTDIKVLKQSAGFTLDGATSSNKLLTLQRNNLTNNLWFTAEYFTGATIAGTYAEKGNYKVGLFSSDGSDGLSHFDASYFALLSFGYNFATPLGLKNAAVRVDYVYNDEDEKSNTSDYSHILSLVTKWEQDKWALWTDLSAGWGYTGESDMWGIVLMPSYDLSPHLKLVLRYTYLDASNENSLVLGRYENEIVEGKGDKYNEIYGGLNVYFYGQKLKWQTGLQYSTMRDHADDGGEYEGWGLTTGLRVFW
jgi:phosphate-selective porin OprO/OprP